MVYVVNLLAMYYTVYKIIKLFHRYLFYDLEIFNSNIQTRTNEISENNQQSKQVQKDQVPNSTQHQCYSGSLTVDTFQILTLAWVKNGASQF